MHEDGGDGGGDRRPVHRDASWPDRLDSWKQIAAYLGRGVTTLQRWEQDEGLPVHRLPHAKRGSVFAFRHELDAWLAQRAQSPPPLPQSQPQPQSQSQPQLQPRPQSQPQAQPQSQARPQSPQAQARPATAEGDAAGTPRDSSSSSTRDGAAAPASRPRFAAIAAGLLLVVIALVAVLYDASGAKPSSRKAGGLTPGATSRPRGVGDAVAAAGNVADAGGAAVSEQALAPVLTSRIVAGEPTGELSPSLSPDGTRLVYAWDRPGDGFGLYIKQVAGGTPIKLATGPGLRFEESPHPTWSPRGDLIAFLAYEAPQIYGVYVVPPNGAAARYLTSVAGIGLCWHPDGQSIGVVDRHSTGEPFSVFAVSVATGQRRRLTTPPAGVFGDTHCAFSNDGGRLAVVRYGTRQVSDLFVIAGVSAHDAAPDRQTSDHHARPARSARSERSGRSAPSAQSGPADAQPPSATPPISEPDESRRTRRLTHDLPGMDGITWTPDDRAVIAGSPRGLWRISVSDDSTPTAITATDGETASPSFARGGDSGHARLVYAYARRDVDIWWWRPGSPGRSESPGSPGSPASQQSPGIGSESGNGKPQETFPFMAGSPQWEDEPALSPDGQHVAFTSNRTGRTEIWIAPALGAQARQLTSHGPVAISPQWSPDGRRIAFVRQVGGDRDIYVIDADGARSARLTWEPSQEENPTWSRDGEWIYFRSDRGGSGHIWKTRARGGEAARRVTTGLGSQAFESPDGRTLYFVRGSDAPGLWSMPVDGGAETLLLPEVRERLWGVPDEGIAFVDRSDLRSPAGLPIRVYEFATGKTSTRAMIAMPPEVTIGFAIARDGRSALWTTVAPSQHDLMLIDLPTHHPSFAMPPVSSQSFLSPRTSSFALRPTAR